jgi:penicillin-binding protein 2
VRDFQPEVIRYLPIDLTHLATVREGLEAAVLYGTATDAQVVDPASSTGEMMRVAGKTGTAEFWCPQDELDSGICRRGKPLPTHAWFTTFAPVENPEIALVVYVYNGGEGSDTAAPIAHDILEWYFQRQASVASQFITPSQSSAPSDTESAGSTGSSQSTP